jgi:hypothetical protein
MLKIEVRKSVKNFKNSFYTLSTKNQQKNIILQFIFTEDFETKTYIELILIIIIIISLYY